ncbi:MULTISPECIES: FAD-binding protein [unclassified Rhizobium]|uniref:FAD-binding protein n=1 Tax=unclassified Rhizobium TaxID=2613769 RepID=UPI001ADAAF79|nr:MULTISPECIES: FAD-binding protein [unclassified Rhizobium]MBO9101485.1 FAD-binding protein [Rhizobium sp. L58/93]MBO9187476.1 FAD-binding protein [Rhizobium sp. E27B/91]QXZ86734.1 FAD-binding protein [Rhizobium sp. K1/93]QXZ93233.1 FAD-binding protein [Rhizobium sp. K15/93]
MTLIPTTEEEAATIIRDHASKGHALWIVGGNSRAGFGNAVSTHSELTSRGMTGIVAYNPGEMVMTARAGTPVEEIEAALAASHQMMAFEPMNHSPLMATSGVPTIGGIFAANASGPRRILAGAARDSLLGVRFVNGRGEIVKAGGRVMKNVTGLDLPKLMAGSHGTLGLLTEVTFRVPPSPKTEQTLVISDLTDEAATKAMAAAMALSVEVSGAAHLPVTVASTFAPAAWSVHSAMVLRIEGLAASVDVRMEKLSRAMAGIGPVGQLPDAESKAVWRAIRDVVPFADGTMRPVWRVSVAPGAGHRLVAALRQEAGVDAFYDWQGGLVWLRMEAEPDGAVLRRHIANVGGGHATLLRATPDARAQNDAFEPQQPAVALLSARIKQKFDPAGIFNPGKMG